MRQPIWRTVAAVTVSLLFACGTASTPVLAPKNVSYSTADGGVTSATLHGSGPRAVVLVHGGRFDKESWEPQARALVAAGFRVLAIDLRGGGGSRAGSAGPDAVDIDVLSAVRWLRTNGATSVGIVGASLGGGAAAEAAIAAEPGEIQNLVLLAHSSIEHPERLRGRKLFVLGRGDMRGEPGVPRLAEVRDQYVRAPEPKELLILETDAHAQQLFQTHESERLMREIIRFLSDSQN